MECNPENLTLRDIYALMTSLITPRPIAWVSTLSPRGIPNLAPFSYFNAIGSNPPALSVSIGNLRDGSKKDTLRNIEASGEFVVNLVSHAVAVPMNATSVELPYEQSEFAFAGVTSAPSARVLPPGVAESPARLECRLLQTVPVGLGAGGATLVIGQIVWFHVRDEILVANESGEAALAADPSKLDTIGRLAGTGYARITDRFDLKRPPRPL
jgi:flavin reductase (DIM6/NTAB) family NADH-FMN oxidoreductase RutF